jgi:hypothetical protein
VIPVLAMPRKEFINHVNNKKDVMIKRNTIFMKLET